MNLISREKFERYCAGVLGYTVDEDFGYDAGKGLVVGSADTHRFNLQAFDNLNQLIIVSDELCKNHANVLRLVKIMQEQCQYEKRLTLGACIKDFVISTMPDEQNNPDH